MIFSTNAEPHKEEFNSLIAATLLELNQQAENLTQDYDFLAGKKLEGHVKSIMIEQAMGTVFENSILDGDSGQKFPDIIAKKYYEVEVKSTVKNHWKSTGNSVLESTRVEGVERIYMLFGKLAKPVEFRCRPYEECLSEVVVTHSPRYLIDMELTKGATIFDKMAVEYDTLRKKPNPIKPVVDYYKSKLRPGEDIWWMGQETESTNSFSIRVWNNLDAIEQNKILVNAMSFFPEIFGNNSKKYDRIPAWLVTHHNVVCKNIRDPFTAGGKKDITIGPKKYIRIPGVFARLIKSLPFIVETLMQTSAIELSEYWPHKTSEKSKLNDWINLVAIEVKKIPDAKHLDIRDMVNIALHT